MRQSALKDAALFRNTAKRTGSCRKDAGKDAEKKNAGREADACRKDLKGFAKRNGEGFARRENLRHVK